MGLVERLAAVTVARRMDTTADLATAADRLGYWGVGISDSPLLYHEMYPTITWLLGQTERISIGTNVTNPVSRHWTVQASSARTLQEIFPDRFFIGLAAGDGAVHSIGREPATRRELVGVVESMRAHMPSEVPIQLAVSGPKMARTAGEVADGLIISTGGDAGALRQLGDLAQAAAPRRLDRWGLVYVEATAPGVAVADRLAAAAPVAMAMSRFSLTSTFEAKNVPAALQDRVRAGFAGYDFHHHAEFDERNPNAHLFDGDAEVFDYLLDRFCIVDEPARCAARLTALLDDGGLDGLWIVLGADDPVGTLERLAAADRSGDDG